MAASNDYIGNRFSGDDYDDDDEASAYAEQIVFNMSFSMVMQTAIELGLFEIIAKAQGSGGRISTAEITDQLSASNKEEAADKVDRMLRLLVAFSVVTSSVDGGGRRVYGLAPAGRYFVGEEDGVSFGPLLCMAQDKVFLYTWSKLKDAILEGGIPFERAHGMHAYEYPSSDTRYNHIFNLGLFNHTTILMKKVLRRYKGFENLKQLVDVGGGLGHTLKIILSKYPSLKGINFDLPHVIEHALSFNIPGVEHVGGNMFESVPAPAEAILMKWVLHDWGDDHCVKLLKNCYNALKDVLVMTRHNGGRERSRKEFMALANAAGFTTVKFQCCACNCWVMEFCK